MREAAKIRISKTGRAREATMGRRDFVKGSAALAGAAAACTFSFPDLAGAARIEVPVIDKLTIWVLTDSSYDVFLRPAQVNGVTLQPAGPLRGNDLRRALHNQWGLALFLESQRA